MACNRGKCLPCFRARVIKTVNGFLQEMIFPLFLGKILCLCLKLCCGIVTNRFALMQPVIGKPRPILSE